MTRQVVLDTETTGLDPQQGHRIIEIGCVELVNRKLTGNVFHQYINPEREIDQGAIEVHGITNESLVDKPKFDAVADDFLEYVKGAELIIHNAPFDVGFLNHEFKRLKSHADGVIETHCGVIDTLKMARKMHPGQKNDLDSLCRRYSVDNTQRTLHGALLDAEILADVYLLMTGGQTGLFEDGRPGDRGVATEQIRRLSADRSPLPVVMPTAEELAAHQKWVDDLESKGDGDSLWSQIESN
ncbi:MAG: DNA polymerase III subunit epsilon [Thiotrichales bacterium SG8_50]|jgi:DNA polymerase-3 subunit epsilon|nr:MAG: DNA polymerase III subunit epsilon [Thiotrichales bacterium SG8_50]